MASSMQERSGPPHAAREARRAITRRHFFANGGGCLGAATLATLGLSPNSPAAGASVPGPHFAPRAKSVIYLHMVGGPPQMDLFDYKPAMEERFDQDLPESIRSGQRLTTMTSGQERFPIAPSKYAFQRCGESGMWVSELLPWTQKMVDDLTFVRSVHTDAINHEPAITLMQTGNQITGRPCIGSWASYGLGSLNNQLPTFVVLVAESTNKEQVQAISSRLWSAGFLDGKHAGVSFRQAGDPVLYLDDPPGVSRGLRRRVIDGLSDLNRIAHQRHSDPETLTRIQQYELAFDMQASVPELTDLSSETGGTYELYGEAARESGTFANSALLARRLVERGVRFVQVYHNNWDTHANVAGRLPDQCRDIDRPCFALVQDLKQRGLLDDTLVIWGGEFGRTIYSQGQLTAENYGRDHHPRCFTMWMAGGGTNAGAIYGETDDFSYNIAKDPVHVRDLHATVLELLGFDHKRLSVRHQGLDQRLTGVLPARVIRRLIA
ncbi:DUF1501 domain-containing protein [Botrimarina sp.]|uniref:DUF1501 domain-containing protein n=1 Tax=Botrimarina sp. TaxID=2795802 RepID=UPI0032ED2A49